VPPGDARFGQAQPCACTAAQRYAELFAGEFANMALENFKVLTPDERAALKAARGAARAWTQDARRSLIFYAALQDSRRAFPGHGELHVTGCGCGKTHLAVGLAKAAIAAGRTVKLTTETALLRDIKRSYGDAAAPDEAVILADLGRAWLLVLDDVGTAAVNATLWYQDILYAIVNQRYTAGLPVVLTSNLIPDQLAERLGPRTWSRLLALAECFRLDGPDRRELRR
jgi:DNA replication protein DnaC